MLDQRKIASEVSRETGIRLEPNDPAFAMARLVEMALEAATARLNSQIRVRLAEFEKAAQQLEGKAGKIVADKVKEAAVEFNSQLDKDLKAARWQVNELLGDVKKSRRWLWLLAGTGFITATMIFGGGLWIGGHFLR